MNLLLDLFPVVCFFLTFKLSQGHADAAARWATEHLGFLVVDGQIAPDQAPVLLATLVVILASLLVMGVQLARGKKIHTLMWVSLGLVVVLGAATVWLHDETFIKWKPTALYWVTALVFLVSHHLFGKNLPQALMGEHAKAPQAVWLRLNWAWVAFGLFMGVLNLWVAYHFSLNTWVNFKLFGAMGLMFVFLMGQALALNRYMVEAPDDVSADANPQSQPSHEANRGDSHAR
jgi:intracellular septation protein